MKLEWQQLSHKWQQGDRDRETCLRAAYIVWISRVELPFCNDLAEGLPVELVMEAFRHLGGETAVDPEVLFVFSVMAAVADWGLGDAAYWSAIGQEFSERLGSDFPTPTVFEGRGAYGEYFAHQATGR